MAKQDAAYSSTVLRERLEVAYMVATGSETSHGMLKWASRELGVSSSTLGR